MFDIILNLMGIGESTTDIHFRCGSESDITIIFHNYSKINTGFYHKNYYEFL